MAREYYSDHFWELAAQMDVTVHERDEDSGYAYLDGWEVVVPRNLDDPYCYLVALHELGHLALWRLSVWGSDVRELDVVTDEMAAWIWAFEHALPVHQRYIDMVWEECLGSYEESVVLSGDGTDNVG